MGKRNFFFYILNKYSLILNCFGQKEPDCLIKTKQTDAHKIDFNCLWILPSALNVIVMKFN